jgi:hypothetical protein
MNAITFKFLIDLVVSKTLNMHLMNVVTKYPHGSLDKDTYMKIFEGFKMLEAFYDKHISVYSIKLQKILYGLK